MIRVDLHTTKYQLINIGMKVQLQLPIIHLHQILVVHIRVTAPRAVVTVDHHLVQVGINMKEVLHPEQLFELFYKNIRSDMQPPFIYKHDSKGVYHFWHERFMNAYHGVQEPHGLRSWAEAPQMWLAGYHQRQSENTPEPKPEFVPPPPLIKL